MGFIDSYKQLEKLCGELLGDDRRVSAYIDEMINTPNGAHYVDSWETDLKTLKQYRWIRNQIVHEPNCTEQTMCKPEYAMWLDNFYARIMNQTDPLALYHKATKKSSGTFTNTQSDNYKRPASKSIGCASWTILSLLIIAGLVLLVQVI